MDGLQLSNEQQNECTAFISVTRTILGKRFQKKRKPLNRVI